MNGDRKQGLEGQDGDKKRSLEELELENKITCGMCGNHFSEPKVLSCLHCYCKDCLEQQANTGEPISCPKCQHKTTLPSGGVNELKTAGFVNRIKTNVERQSWLSNTLEANCELCTAGSKAESFCQDCDKFICNICVDQHSRWSTHAKHKIASLDGIKGRGNSIPVKKSPAFTCSIHEQKSLDFYCYDCKLCICRECSLEKEEHEHHQYDKNITIVSKIKEKLNKESDHIKQLLVKIKTATIEIDKAKDNIETKEKSNIQHIHASFDELSNVLREYEQKLVNRAKELAQNEIDQLLKQETGLSQASIKVQSLVDFTDLCMVHSVDNELICIHDIIEQRMEHVMIKLNGIEKSLNPKVQEEVVVELACADELRNFCVTKFFVTEQICHENLVQIFDETSTIIECELCRHNLMHRRKAFWTTSEMIICPKCAENDVIYLGSLKAPNVKCTTHNKKPLIYFCSDCKICICNSCQTGEGEHKSHKMIDLKMAADQERMKIQNINRLPKLHLKLKERLNKINSIKQKIKEKEKIAISSLRNSYSELHKVLSWSEQDSIEKIQIAAYEILQKLLVPEKKLSSVEKEVVKFSNFVDECVDQLLDADIIRLHTVLTQKITEKLREHYTVQQLDNEIELVERADIGVELPHLKALQDFCCTNTSIMKRMDPLESSVYMNRATDIGVPFTAALVITKLGDSQQAKNNYNVVSNVESLYDKVVSKCIVEDEGSGQYNIKFTPIVRGQHHLNVLVDEQHISGSPFSIFVSVSPNSLTKKVTIWNDVTRPFGGTINSKHGLLCIENFKRIIELTPDGGQNVLVQNCELERLSSIACDEECNVFGVDELSEKIFTCDHNGDNIQVLKVELINGKGRGALLILNNNEFMTTDRGESHDTLCVYNRDFTLIRQTQLTIKVRDISVDSLWNIYATDSDNCCVHVFNNSGKELQTLKFDKEQIQFPWGISIFNQHIYLTDCGRHSVAVFTTEGTFLTSIGDELEKRLNHPLKILVDENSFVYIFDHFNNRILCY